MAALKKFLVLCTLLLAVNAKNLPLESNDGTYGMVFDSIFDPSNLQVPADESSSSCTVAYMERNVKILEAFGNATLACENLPSTDVAAFFEQNDKNAYKKKFSLKMQQCERAQECYTNTVSSAINEVSIGTGGSSSVSQCLVSSATDMVDQLDYSSDLMVACVDNGAISGAVGSGILGGIFGGNVNTNN